MDEHQNIKDVEWMMDKENADFSGTVDSLVRFFIPAKQMPDGELILDWDEKVDWTQDTDDLDPLNVGWFWIEIKSVTTPNATGEPEGATK